MIWPAATAAQAQPTRDASELSFADGKKLLDQARAFGKPSPIFILPGGDPFKRPDLFDLVQYSTEIGLAMAVSPSGTPLLTRDNHHEGPDAYQRG